MDYMDPMSAVPPKNSITNSPGSPPIQWHTYPPPDLNKSKRCLFSSVSGSSSRDHFVYAPNQWETTLQCNVVSHWLGAYTKLSLYSRGYSWCSHMVYVLFRGRGDFSHCVDDILFESSLPTLHQHLWLGYVINGGFRVRFLLAHLW